MNKEEAKLLVKELGQWLNDTDEIKEPEHISEVRCYKCSKGTMKFIMELESIPPIPVFECNNCKTRANLNWRG